jgi:hypothetical protein
MIMATRKRLAVSGVLVLALAGALSLAGARPAGSYPGAGEGFQGWTGEVAMEPNNPRHVQATCAGGYLYVVAGDGSDVTFRRTTNTSDLYDWTGWQTLDVNAAHQAREPYIDASGNCVAVSFTELMGSKWATVVKISSNNGASWTTWYDSNPGCNNWEAHVDIAGSRVHCAYVSDYPGPGYPMLEVYYLRFSLAGALEAQSCATDNHDGVAATQPCIEATSASFANLYYVRGNSSPHPVYEAWTQDAGANWGITEIIPTGPGTDMSWPECSEFWEGSDRRKMVVADGRNTTTNFHTIYYARYYSGAWNEKGTHLCELGTDPSYPQVDERGNDLLVVYRGSGGTTGSEGQARINLDSGDGNWSFIDDLFYNNMPYNGCAPIDCCSDGTRFYAVSAGTGSSPTNQVLIKREDTQDPAVSINDPGTYHNGDITVWATASDDFHITSGWLLHPHAEPFDEGIMHALFYYRYNGGDWEPFNSGEVDWQAPWGKTLYAGGLSDGIYDFKVVVTDTADRVSEDTHTGVFLDRTPPAAEMQISGPDGDNGWYINQPSFGPVAAGSDKGSGIKQTYYRFDGAADWIIFSKPFALLEGEHQVHYYAEDKAGNTSGAQTFSYKADFTDPQGQIVSPPPENYYQKTMGAEASCADGGSGVESVAWLVDGIPITSGVGPQAVLDISGLKDGQHVLEAEIKDAAGRKSRTAQVLFYKDVTPPSVEVVEPTGEHWVRGMVTVKADIRDNLKVGRAEFFIDGDKIDERTSTPWMASWDTSTVKNGYHAVRVEAWDAAGNRAEVTASGETTVYVGNNISETNNFAEGCTRQGFDTWLCLQNPGDDPANVTVNYYLGMGQGTASTRTYALPPHSRSTIYVNNDVGADKDVSIQVTSSKPIVSERPMYFDYQGTAAHHWKGCHTAQGAHFPRQEWYFAEGCTRPGFETWLCLQNPEGREAEVKVEYMMENGATLDRTYRVSPWSRGTVLVNREVGPDHDVSMRVSSNTPVVAERPVYFLYQGMWDGGHNVMGAAQPEKEWYFAEGCTRTGFNQWICLQNPNPEPATASIAYVMEDGGRIEREYALAPRSRFTVNVNNDVARQHDVSAHISSGLPIVAERPMYFLYNSSIDEGSNAMGVCRPGSSWYLAEGCTRAGFEEWICLMNPGGEAAEVVLRFMLEDSSEREHVVTVPPGTRVTVKVNDVVGPEHDVSTEVMSDRPVIVERPMYSVYRGSCPSGDTLSGYTFNP